MTRRFWGITLLAFALTAGLGLALAREQAGGVTSARTAAEAAWRAASTTKSRRSAAAHAADEAFVVLRAKSAAAVGDYARAESLLQPAGREVARR